MNLPVFPESFSHCPVPLLSCIAQLLKTTFTSPLLNPLHPSLCPPVWWKTTLPRSLVNSELCPSLELSASYCASTLPSGPTIPWPSGSSSHSPLLTPSPLPSLCLEPSLPRSQSQGFRYRPLWRCLFPNPTCPELRLPSQPPLCPCSSLPGGSALAQPTFSGWLRALLTQSSLSFSYVSHPVPLNISQILLLAADHHLSHMWLENSSCMWLENPSPQHVHWEHSPAPQPLAELPLNPKPQPCVIPLNPMQLIYWKMSSAHPENSTDEGLVKIWG